MVCKGYELENSVAVLIYNLGQDVYAYFNLSICFPGA